MKLYENVVIGNFLYGLGVSIGGRLESGYIPGAVSLLQQTPEDKALGDVLVAFPGTLRLIEFKAKGNYSTKEAERYQKLSLILQGKPEMEIISRRMHWYVETAPSQISGLATFFSPYLDAFDTKTHKRQPYALERFINSVAADAISQRDHERPQVEKDYLKLVRWCQGAEETGAGALIVIVGSGGSIEFVALEDLMELNMSYGQWMSYQHDMEIRRENALKMAIEENTLTRVRGNSL